MDTLKRIVLISFVALVSFSCTSDDDQSDTASSRLDGSWTVVSVSCNCTPFDFSAMENIWTFDLDTNNVVVLTDDEEQLRGFIEAGTYDIKVSSNTVVINSVTYDYYFENDNLFLANEPEVDGPLIEFVRN